MVKVLFAGLWACLIAVGATYGVITWKTAAIAPAAEGKDAAPVAGLESHKLEQFSVPMLRDGKVAGYVLAKLAFTADASAVRGMSVDPQPFVTDEAFREIYSNNQIDFSHMEKYDLTRLADSIKAAVNQRLGGPLLHDILVLEINYVDKASLKPPAPTG